jgi:hydroxypyruvate reductase
MQNHHDNLLAIFKAALRAVNGQLVVKKELENHTYPNEFHLIAIGKAADSMLQGIASNRIKTALLISKHGHISEKSRNNSRIICIESDHPVPRESSLKAGQALLDYLQQLPEDAFCMFLISGGASSLVEVLEENWTLPQLQELTDYLLANAYSINEINAIRRRLSKIKGGGLWRYIGQRSVRCLMISDVPDDDPAVIGSGLLFPDSESELPDLPEKWQQKLAPFVLKHQGDNFQWKIIASLEIAKQAAARKSRELTYDIHVVPEFLNEDATKTAIYCVKTIQQKPQTLFIWGGETTVNLPSNPGQGGRNQHLALAAAIEMQGLRDTYLLAAGTDGTDGVTNATGAIVSGATINQGLAKNLIAEDYLQRADSNTYLTALDAVIVTGATGTNVMDLVLGISISK